MDVPDRPTFGTYRIAGLIGRPPAHVARLIDARVIKGYRLPGGERRVTRANLIAFLESLGPNQPTEKS